MNEDEAEVEKHLREENARLQAENKKLEAALSDMLLLIAEHGDRIMQAHATRIEAARKVLYRGAEALRWIKELENYGIG